MKKKKCKNPFCPNEYFYLSRIDQVFCCTSCRNQFNNNAYKLRIAPYKEVSDHLRRQDEDLDNLLKGNKAVLINFDKLAAYSINLQNAKTLTFFDDGRLKKAEFVMFHLSFQKDNLYKVERK